MSRSVLPDSPPELVVYDRLSACPYLPDQVARLPLRLPLRRLSGRELDERLAFGDRRQGVLLYRTACPDCRVCEPLRVDVPQFRERRSMRRTRRRAQAVVRVEMGPPVVDARRVELYNLHKSGRGLGDGQTPIDLESYSDFLVDTCCPSFELRYFVGSELVGVAITDRGADSLSAVYCYFDPAYQSLGLGTFSILEQIELCRRLKLRWLYLGLFIAQNEVMRYKSGFLPHERLIGGAWRRYEQPQRS